MQSVIQCTATVARVLCDRYDGHVSLGVVRCVVVFRERKMLREIYKIYVG
jgi:hypothetical protein